jgi:hypothetical protein
VYSYPATPVRLQRSTSRELAVMRISDLFGSMSVAANRFGSRRCCTPIDTGVSFADPSVVEQITTGVDVAADNTTCREMSRPIPNTGHSLWRSASQTPSTLVSHRLQFGAGAVAGQ